MIVSISIGIHNIDTVTANNQYPARIRFAKAQNSTHRRVSWTFRRNFFFYTLLLSANASASIFNSFFSVLLIFQTLSLVSVDAAGSWCACQTNETVNQLFFFFLQRLRIRLGAPTLDSLRPTQSQSQSRWTAVNLCDFIFHIHLFSIALPPCDVECYFLFSFIFINNFFFFFVW